MIRNQKYLSLLIERKRHDWSFLPVVCWSRVCFSFLWFVVLRYIIRNRSVSFYALLGVQASLFKTPYRNLSASRLKQFITKVIARDIYDEMPVCFHLPKVENLFESDIQYIKRNGGIVLKIPSFAGERTVEKGVLLLKHAISFRFFCYYTNVLSVLDHYTLILEPGWSGYTDPAILYFTRFKDHHVVVMAPEKRDYDFLKAIGTNLIPVNLGPSDWSDPSIFHPLKDQEKRYDVVMVASWLKLKRHHVLFRVLRELNDPSFKVALVSHSSNNREEIELLVDIYGVRGNITFFEQLSQEEVNRILNQSKVNLLLSLRECGNKALFEGFFAGVPGIALKNNIGIPKGYFTPQTGKLIKEKNLKSELLYFRKHWNDFNPRAWAEANITPEISTTNLNAFLKNLAHQRGEEWTKDVVAKCNAPDLKYYPDENIGFGMPSYTDILVQYASSQNEV